MGKDEHLDNHGSLNVHRFGRADIDFQNELEHALLGKVQGYDEAYR